MTVIGKPNRRSVLRWGLAAGGLTLSFDILDRAEAAESASFMPNAFVRIASDGRTTVWLPKTEMGQGVFTAIPMLIAEELEVPLEAITVELPHGEAGLFGSLSQATGGSTSIKDAWVPVRTAAATARSMLIQAAAQSWGVAPDACHAANGQVIHRASARQVAYGSLVAAASRLPVPAAPELKSPSQFNIIGKPTRRMDGPAKANGAAQYGIDVAVPDMQIAMLAISPVPGGSLSSVDERAAMAIAGVQKVVRLPDAIAVVASNTWAAKLGLDAASPAWRDGDNAKLDQESIVAQIHDALGRDAAVASQTGDLDAVTGTGRYTHEATYEQPFLAHAALEPLNCTVHVRTDSCEVWVGTQVPDDARAAAARAAALPIEKVTLHNFLMGGGFGRRLETDMVERAVEIGRHVAAPVKVIWSREQDTQHDLYRPYYVDRLSARLDAEGKLQTWVHRIAGSSIMARLYPRSFKGVDVDAVDGAIGLPYPALSTLVEYSRQESLLQTSWWRGVGPLRNAFVVESFIDELAHLSGNDPLAYRLMLIQEPRARAVLLKVGDAAGWSAPLPAGRARGLSLVTSWGTCLAQVVELSVDANGEVRVHQVTVAVDCGQVINPEGVRAQVEGGVIFGLSAALFGEITVKAGRVEQSNFHDFRVLRMNEAPSVETHLIESTASPGGMGEPPTAGVAPAVANAIFAATGVRLRNLPLSRYMRELRAGHS